MNSFHNNEYCYICNARKLYSKIFPIDVVGILLQSLVWFISALVALALAFSVPCSFCTQVANYLLKCTERLKQRVIEVEFAPPIPYGARFVLFALFLGLVSVIIIAVVYWLSLKLFIIAHTI